VQGGFEVHLFARALFSVRQIAFIQLSYFLNSTLSISDIHATMISLLGES
jgi:hypothetical protein